jgi:hypothetical protein
MQTSARLTSARRVVGGAALLVAGLCAWPMALEIPGLAGVVAVADTQLDFELVAATASADGAQAWLAVAARPKGKPTGAETMRLVSVGATSVQSTVEVPIEPASASPASPDRPGRRHLLQGIALAPDGSVVLALARGQAPVSLLRVSSTDRRAGAPAPLALKTDADLTGLARLSNGQLLALGTMGRPVVAEVAAGGAVGWERILPADGAVLESATPTDDGGAIVVGRIGSDPTTAKLWLGSLSAKGELVAQATFPGHDGKVARLRDGSHVLVFDRIAAKGFDVFVKALGPDLRERSTTPLMTGQLLTGAFRVAPTPDGGYVIAAVKDRGRFVARYDATGAERWADARPPTPPTLEIVTRIELLPRGRTFVMPYAAYIVDGREQRQVVRVARFTVD